MLTREAVEAFQRTHLSCSGRPLRVDGSIGPETQWAIDLQTLCRDRRQIVQTAQMYVGLSEEPPASNSDPAGLISGWLSRCECEPHDPWCAAFASYCISQGLDLPVHEGGAQRLGKRFPATTAPVAGDVMWFPTGPVHGHCGIVVGVSPLDVVTIEGNCANGVRCVRRSRAELRFSRTVEDISGKCPSVVPSAPPAPKGTR